MRAATNIPIIARVTVLCQACTSSTLGEPTRKDDKPKRNPHEHDDKQVVVARLLSLGRKLDLLFLFHIITLSINSSGKKK